MKEDFGMIAILESDDCDWDLVSKYREGSNCPRLMDSVRRAIKTRYASLFNKNKGDVK